MSEKCKKYTTVTVVILQGNHCKCFDAGSGLSADADGELDYEEDKGVKVRLPWSSNSANVN